MSWIRYNCPSCLEWASELKDAPGVWSCECGMTFRPTISGVSLAFSDHPREGIRKVIENTLQVYEVKNEETNRARRREKERAVEYLTNEVLKGPIEGGTMAEPQNCSRFGSDVWTALQRAIIIRDPVCRICGQKPSKEVHHIRPRHLKGKDHPRNLIGVCLDCHDEIHRRIDDGIQNVLESSFRIAIPRNQRTLDMEEEE